MQPVDRFVTDITELLTRRPERDEFGRGVVRSVSALVGAVAITKDGFATAQEVAGILREARVQVAERVGFSDQAAKHAVLVEIDKVLAVVGRNNLLPASLT